MAQRVFQESHLSWIPEFEVPVFDLLLLLAMLFTHGGVFDRDINLMLNDLSSGMPDNSSKGALSHIMCLVS